MHSVVAVVVFVLAAAAHAQRGNLCPHDCNDRGHCSEDGLETCTCWEPFIDAPDCSRQPCPIGNSWFDGPDDTGEAHFPTQCSNRGRCDSTRGVCTCDIGFTGAACQYMICPTGGGVLCSGHGVCTSMREAAESHDTRYTEWDADQMFGCLCDEGFTGHDCSLLACPFGDDPFTVGTQEIQVVRTILDHQDEIQRISITGSPDTDEVQRLSLLNVFGAEPAAGTIRFLFDTTNCNLCDDGLRSSEFTELVDFDADAAAVEAALEAMSNVDDVTVSALVDEIINVQIRYTWLVTFISVGLGGDVPQIILDDSTLAGDGNTPSSTTDTEGTEVQGTITLEYDDTVAVDNNPVGSVGLNSATIQPGMTAAEVETELEGMGNLGDGVSVVKELNGGPGVDFVVTFADFGNRQQLAVASDTLAIVNGGTTSGVATSTTSDGAFLGGTFQLSYLGTPTASLAWDIGEADMKAAIEGLDTALGLVVVNRVEFRPVVEDWSGNYDWAITFLGQSSDATDIVVADSASLTGGATASVVVGTGSAQIRGDEQDAVDAEVNEVQLLECVCDTCTGSFKLDVLGARTQEMLGTETASTLATKLATLDAINGISVSVHGSSTGEICDADGVTTAITFTHNPGDVPGMVVAEFGLASAGTLTFNVLHGTSRGSQGAQAKQGTRVLVECSGRGFCDPRSGDCSCYTGYVASDGGGIDVSAGDGALVGAGNFQDCGFPEGPIVGCPSPTAGLAIECSGRGTCETTPQASNTCVCTLPTLHGGGACDRFLCPEEVAWFDEQTVQGGAHSVTECSNRGQCERTSGTCQCDAGFGTRSCNTFACPNCGNDTPCMTMREAAPFTVDRVTGDEVDGAAYTEWDADKLQGCVCNNYYYSGFYEHHFSRLFGSECRQLECGLYDDPRTDLQVDEVQIIRCQATAGFFVPGFRNTLPGQNINFDADLTRVKAVLELIPAITFVDVSMTGTQACASGAANEITVTFRGTSGDLPLIRVFTGELTGTADVIESVAGTKEAVECNNRGNCVYSTGRCDCAIQYGTSDGDGNVGTLGDCGHLDALHQFGQGNLPVRLPTNNSNFAF